MRHQYEQVRVTTLTRIADQKRKKPLTRHSVHTMWIREDCRGSRLTGALVGKPVSQNRSPFVTWMSVRGSDVSATYSDTIESALQTHELKLLELVERESLGSKDEHGVIHLPDFVVGDYTNPDFTGKEETHEEE